MNWRKEMGQWIPTISLRREDHKIKQKEKQQIEHEGVKKEKDDEGQADSSLSEDCAEDPKGN
jgi:hypothetical protein